MGFNSHYCEVCKGYCRAPKAASAHSWSQHCSWRKFGQHHKAVLLSCSLRVGIRLRDSAGDQRFCNVVWKTHNEMCEMKGASVFYTWREKMVWWTARAWKSAFIGCSTTAKLSLYLLHELYGIPQGFYWWYYYCYVKFISYLSRAISSLQSSLQYIN